MGANFSYEDFSSCSSTSRTQFPYQPSCISSSTPSLRISSAPSTRGSMRSRHDKSSTPPPSPSSLPRPPPPPPPPKPFIDHSYDRSKVSSDSTKKTTGELSKPIRIEAKKSLDVVGELTLSCPSMLTAVSPPPPSSACHVVNPTGMTQSFASSNAQFRSQCLMENGAIDEGQGNPPPPPPLPLPPSTHIQAFLPPSMEAGVCSSCCFSSREIDLLRNETRILRAELTESRKTISLMKEKEKLLRHRLSEQARRQLERGSTKFEDISLGENRPSQLVRRYGNLYSEGRLEAMEALDELQEVTEFSDLKEKLLLSVIVLAFRNAKKNLEEMKVQMRRLLCISDLSSSSSSSSPPDGHESSLVQRTRPLPSLHPAVTELESIISVFLRKTVDHQNLSKSCQEVRDRVWSTLYDFPKLRFCRGLQRYIEECVRLAWLLSIQNPSFVVDYKAKVFSPDTHTRFHTSNPDSNHIRSVLWPTLREGSETGPCVYKGVVIT